MDDIYSIDFVKTPEICDLTEGVVPIVVLVNWVPSDPLTQFKNLQLASGLVCVIQKKR